MSKLPEVCHDCEVPLGSIHEFGCDMEECPICHGQLFLCGCPAEFFNWSFDEAHDFTDEEVELWKKHVEKVGRIPYGSELWGKRT